MTTDCDKLLDELRRANRQLESDEVDRLSREYARRCVTQPTKTVKNTLTDLRRKRFFGSIQRIAEAFILASADDSDDVAIIRLQLAQARIDQEKLDDAISILETLAGRYTPFTHIGQEARGLLGRIAKQKYVDKPEARDWENLHEAVGHYYSVYREPQLRGTCWWHGINSVACLARAERDGLLDKVNAWNIDWRQEAAAILATVSDYDRTDDDFTWAAATALEACIALEDEEKAIDWCDRYIDAPFADSFEMGSTERQLREVWQIDTRMAPGFNALRILQGALGLSGGSLELSATPTAIRAFDAVHYQAQLGDEAAQSVKWIENLFARCRSVAWIASKTDDSKSGTGFFVSRDRAVLNGRKLPVPDIGGDLWLITNFHVLNSKGERLNEHTPPAIRFDNAKIRLTLLDGQPEYDLGQLARDGKALIYAQLKEPFDFTLVAIDLPDIVEQHRDFGIPMSEHDEIMPHPGVPDPRLYVIGHPHGGVMKVSLYDNELIVVNPPDLQYRSPTEAGNSGSPVLSRDLNAVAIHQGTIEVSKARKLPDDDSDEVMPANKGILLDAIADHLAKTGAPAP